MNRPYNSKMIHKIKYNNSNNNQIYRKKLGVSNSKIPLFSKILRVIM